MAARGVVRYRFELKILFKVGSCHSLMIKQKLAAGENAPVEIFDGLPAVFSVCSGKLGE